jgi:hypothetical protein
MRKLMMLAAMLALVAVVAVVPAMASEDGFIVIDDNGDVAFVEDFGDFEDFFGDDFFDDFDEEDFEDFFEDFDGNGIDDDDDAAAAPVAVQEFGQEAESGDVSLSNEVVNTGDNSNVCAPTQQFANTGNLQNAQGFVQYGTETDDIEFSGSSFVFEPSLEAVCDQTIEQSAVAYGY